MLRFQQQQPHEQRVACHCNKHIKTETEWNYSTLMANALHSNLTALDPYINIRAE